MKKCILIISLFTVALLLINCARNQSNPITTNSDYNPLTNVLKVDYLNKPDTSLLEIIELSNISKSGYGLLLNINNSHTRPEIDTLKRKFQKLDINAVHSYNVITTETLQSKIKVAMEGAKFIWLLNRKNINVDSTYCGRSLTAIQNNKEDKILIVLANH